MRFILLTVLNLALPFLLRWAWLVLLDWQQKKPIEKRMIDVTPKQKYPIPLLLACGIGLLLLSLLFFRITEDSAQTRDDGWHSANPAQSRVNE